MCFLLSIILPFQSAEAHAPAVTSPDQFWEDYETNRSVTNVVEHVQKLSTRMETDNLERLEFKKASVLWFLATGGKYGFLKRVATSAEKDIMINALIFGTMLHRVSHADEILHLIDVRRDAKIEIEDDLVSTHLMEAQRIITATQIMLVSSSQNIKKRIQELFNNEYMATVPPSKNIKPETAEWQQEVGIFSNVFTIKFDKQTKQVFNNLKLSFNSSNTYFGFKKSSNEEAAVEFRELTLKNCTYYLESEELFLFYSEHEHDSDENNAVSPQDHLNDSHLCKLTQEGLKKMNFCLPCNALDVLHVLDFIEDAKSDSEIEALDTIIYLLTKKNQGKPLKKKEI